MRRPPPDRIGGAESRPSPDVARAWAIAAFRGPASFARAVVTAGTVAARGPARMYCHVAIRVRCRRTVQDDSIRQRRYTGRRWRLELLRDVDDRVPAVELLHTRGSSRYGSMPGKIIARPPPTSTTLTGRAQEAAAVPAYRHRRRGVTSRVTCRQQQPPVVQRPSVPAQHGRPASQHAAPG